MNTDEAPQFPLPGRQQGDGGCRRLFVLEKALAASRGGEGTLSHPRGAAPHPKKCPKSLPGAGSCWTRRCRPALGSEGKRLQSFPWHIPCRCPFNSRFGTIPEPLRPPRPDNSQSHPPPEGWIPAWGCPQSPHPPSPSPGGTHGCPCTGTSDRVAVAAAGLGVSLLPSRSRGVCREIVIGEPNK